MTECYYQLEKSLEDINTWARTDYDFHKSIYDASNNELLANMLQILSKVQLDYRFATNSSSIINNFQQKQYLQFHKELLIAICNHDEKSAEQKMYELQEGLAHILSSMATSQNPKFP